MLKIVNEIIIQASHDTGAYYVVSKCIEIIFQNGKMVRGEGLQEERMKSPDYDIYKFLGIEQTDGIKTKVAYKWVRDEITNIVKILIKVEGRRRLKVEDKDINMKVVPIATYAMNICQFTLAGLRKLDQIIKKELRENGMLGKQANWWTIVPRIQLTEDNNVEGLTWYSKVKKRRGYGYVIWLVPSNETLMQKESKINKISTLVVLRIERKKTNVWNHCSTSRDWRARWQYETSVCRLLTNDELMRKTAWKFRRQYIDGQCETTVRRSSPDFLKKLIQYTSSTQYTSRPLLRIETCDLTCFRL